MTPTTSSSTSPSAYWPGCAASALPANPVGYITVSLDGTDRKIPYYNV